MTDADLLKLRVLLRLGARLNGFETNLWTLRRVRDVIERSFDKRYSFSSVHKVVHSFGFIPHDAFRRAREQAEAAVTEFRSATSAKVRTGPARGVYNRVERRE